MKNILQRSKTGIEKCRPRRQIPDLDKYLIFSFTVLILYTFAEFITSTITGVSHDALTVALFGAFGGETLLCAIIKKHKLKRGD